MAVAQDVKNLANLAGKGVNPMEKAKMARNFLQHWHILAVAAIFDILGLIPLLNVATNFVFFLILWMYFGPKSKGGSEFMKIGVNGAINTIFDGFTIIWIPCIAGTIIRILLD